MARTKVYFFLYEITWMKTSLFYSALQWILGVLILWYFYFFLLMKNLPIADPPPMKIPLFKKKLKPCQSCMVQAHRKTYTIFLFFSNFVHGYIGYSFVCSCVLSMKPDRSDTQNGCNSVIFQSSIYKKRVKEHNPTINIIEDRDNWNLLQD